LSDKDEIKELFQKELGNYEAKVDPSLWNGIQSGLTGASTAGGTAAGISVATKAVIGVVIATLATISTIVIFSNQEIKREKQTKVEKIEPLEEPKENYSEDIAVNESNENSINNEAENKTELIESNTITKEVEEVDNEIKNVEISEILKTLNEEIPNIEEENKYPTNTSPPTDNNEEKESKDNVELDKPIIADITIVKQDNQYVKFNLAGENIEHVEWYFGDGRSSSEFSPEHFYEEPGKFEVIAIIHGGNDEIIEKTISVNVEVQGRFTNLPNIFSPNNDGINDEFFVEHEGISELQLNIFNKRQELIFTTNDLNFKWRGYDSKGERVPDGEYIYVIIAKDKAGNVINKYETLTVNR